VTSAPIPEIHPAEQTPEARPTVGFVSLGCPKNLVDSEVMMGLLDRGGARLTPRAEDADILVVNTCSFIDSAKQESVNTILEMVQHKIANGGRAKKLIVAGCLVERYREEIQRNIPEVDAVVGTGELEQILEAAGLSQYQPASPFPILSRQQSAALDASLDAHSGAEREAHRDQIRRAASSVNQHSRPGADSLQVAHESRHNLAESTQTSRPEGDARERAGRFSREAWDGATAALPNYLYSDETPRILATPRASAYIKIAEGCDHPCSFCIIPQLRGKFRSRTIASVVAEARSLIAQGVREITLIGQDTTCFGEDLPVDPATGKRPELADLLDALAPVEGLVWLRFLYAYPNKVTTRLLESIARHANVAKYLDLPLQHASANVLRRMKRGGTADRFLTILANARRLVPGILFRTSFIVGFPGETDEDFAELMKFVEDARIDWLGVFTYSDEEGAAAFDLDQKVPARTKESRRRKLMRLQQRLSRKARKHWVGRTVDVLVEGESEETELLWKARTLMHAPEIDGVVLINDFGTHESLVPGTFYKAEITEAHDYDVVARIVE
jgi:ribosomal protein S12 methylthiotransferase